MIRRFIDRLLGRDEPARRGSSSRRPRPPRHVPASEHGIDARRVSANAVRVTRTLQDAGHKAFIVGGAVRDLLLGITPKDFDIATDAPPEAVRRLFRRARIIGRRFRLVHVMFGADTIEVSTFRANLPDNAQTDEHGRVLQDNVFGSQEDDAARRDFTINALFYNPADQTVTDYHRGVEDLRARLVRVIGDPARRYREDPVRMLRAVRFAAKLEFTLASGTDTPIAELAPLLRNVPAPRLFDEMLKLLFSGHALACLAALREHGLHHGVLPLIDVAFEKPEGERFVTLALKDTDARIRGAKSASPSFLFACLLWHDVLTGWEAGKAKGEAPIPALMAAAEQVLVTQTETLAIQRRYSSDMREIWELQPRLERRSGRAPHRLIEHPRFRAAYDFLKLRCTAGECDVHLGNWWTRFAEADIEGREALQKELDGTAVGSLPNRKKRRRRGARAGTGGPTAT